MVKANLSIKEKIVFDEPMKKHTSFKIGGVADQFLKANTLEELIAALNYAKEEDLPLTIIGNGSNLLVTDKGIRGLVIKINIQDIKIEQDKDFALVTVGAGYKMMQLAQQFVNLGISGFEELSGIPGSIGGAIYMNAGAYGKEMKDIVVSTKCIDLKGNIIELTNEEQEFCYRSSVFNKKKYIIVEAILKLKYGDKEEIKQKVEKYLSQRKEKQPIDKPSAGSSFKRYEGQVTAKLIEECGLKGYSIGGAKVSEKHAGFIVNYNNATAKDILDLVKYVKEKVYEKYGIKIQEEIRIIGEE